MEGNLRRDSACPKKSNPANAGAPIGSLLDGGPPAWVDHRFFAHVLFGGEN